MEPWVVALLAFVAIVFLLALIFASQISKLRKAKKYERGLKMVSLLIHLPPTTDDITEGGRDKRDIANEAISKAQVMYSILASTITKGFKTKLYGQRHFSFEIISKGDFIRYYAIVPAVLTDVVKQSIQSAYPTARIEEKGEENIFAPDGKIDTISGAELTLNKDYYLPIATYEDTKRDASLAILNALSSIGKNEGAAVQILFRPEKAKKSKQFPASNRKSFRLLLAKCVIQALRLLLESLPVLTPKRALMLSWAVLFQPFLNLIPPNITVLK